MPEACPLCREAFAAHFAHRAFCAARWRGASFDAAAAKGAVGIAVMDALGWTAREPGALDRFQARVRVEAYRATPPADLNSEERFDPAEGEWWEFHVGFRDAPPAGVAEKAATLVGEALARSRNYSRVTRIDAA